MKLLSLSDLKSKGIPYTRGHIHRLVKVGKFPKPIKIGENRNAWTEPEIDKYVEEKIAERDQAEADPEAADNPIRVKPPPDRKGGGGSKNCSAGKFDAGPYRQNRHAATASRKPRKRRVPACLALITVEAACEVTGEKPATMIGWIIKHKIGQHVQTGRGPGGAWMVDPVKLARLRADLESAP